MLQVACPATRSIRSTARFPALSPAANIAEPPALLLPEGNNKRDSENVRIIHPWLAHLTPVQASDPRLWTYLTHFVYSDYTAARWPVAADADVTRRIRERYFVEGESLASITEFP